MEAQGFELTVKHFLCLMQAFIRADQLEKAMEGFDAMDARNLQPGSHFYSQLITSLGRAGCLAEVVMVRKIIEGRNQRIDTYIYNSLIDAYMKNGEFAYAQSLFTQLLEDKNERPNSVTFNSLINGMAKARDKEGAFRVFEHMQEMGIKPDALTYNSLIDASVKSNDVRGARRVLEEMIDSGIHPTTVSFNSIIFAYTRRRDLRVGTTKMEPALNVTSETDQS